MQNLWNDGDARACGDDPLALRVYASRLLGREASLVLHGGGNTSVKTTVRNVFGDAEDVLLVKGSGWDLATIEAPGFAPVRLEVLRRLATLEHISDTALVRAQRAAMTDPTAPDPSVEAVLHAIIPYTYVDHTHADAVVALTNTSRGAALIAEVYGESVLVVPYVMPGFPLARAVHALSQRIDWSRYAGMVLLHHGIFTWGDTARESYDAMIRLVSLAEERIQRQSRATRRNRRIGSRRGVDAERPASRRIGPRDATDDRDVGRHTRGARVREPARTCPASRRADRSRRITSFEPSASRWSSAAIPCATLPASPRRTSSTFGGTTTARRRCSTPRRAGPCGRGTGVVTFGRSARDARVVRDIAEQTIARDPMVRVAWRLAGAARARPVRRRVLGARAGQAANRRRWETVRRSRRARHRCGEWHRTSSRDGARGAGRRGGDVGRAPHAEPDRR